MSATYGEAGVAEQVQRGWGRSEEDYNDYVALTVVQGGTVRTTLVRSSSGSAIGECEVGFLLESSSFLAQGNTRGKGGTRKRTQQTYVGDNGL
jgi:hypothetical protein